MFYREEEALSDTDETNYTEEIIRAKAELKEAKEYTAKIKRLYELAASRLEQIEKGVLSAYEASPEEVELEMYTHNINLVVLVNKIFMKLFRWWEMTNRMKASEQTDQS